MKIAYKHILRFLEDKPNIEELSSKLFQLGHEHEIEDAVFDMEFTPNRGDCFSVQGLVRDLNVFYKTNSNIPIYGDDIPALKLNFINEIGLTNHLSPTRANGLLEMVKQMKAYAYSLMIKNNLNE